MVVRKLCNLAKPGKVFAPVTYNRPFRGVVVRTASEKTVMVKVAHRRAQRIYGNFMTTNKLYMCHDEYELCNIGDEIMIQKSKPYSKRKHWKVHSWIKREPSALWFKIHPDYNIDDVDKQRLAEKVDFDYKFNQEAFEFSPKEIYEIQEGVRHKTLLPERTKKTLHDQLVIGTLIKRADRKSPEIKVEEARSELAKIIEEERRKRESYGLPPTWSLDDEPGVVTVARMKLRTARNEFDAQRENLIAATIRDEELLKRARNLPADAEPAFPHLSKLVKDKKY